MAPQQSSKKMAVQPQTTQKMIQKALTKFEARSRELKLVNVLNASTYVTTGAVGTVTQNITQGDTATTRDGNSINVKQIDYCWLTQNASAAGNDFVRLIVFVDTQAQGALPTATDILSTATVSALYAFGVIITKRFRILKDVTFASAPLGGGPNPHVLRGSINLNNHHVQYLSSAGTAADNGAGSIFFLVINDGGGTFSAYDVNFLVRYYDS